VGTSLNTPLTPAHSQREREHISSGEETKTRQKERTGERPGCKGRVQAPGVDLGLRRRGLPETACPALIAARRCDASPHAKGPRTPRPSSPTPRPSWRRTGVGSRRGREYDRSGTYVLI
jgi:hypothetical protein